MTKFAYFCGHEQWQPEALVRHAVLAEEAGFDMVVVSEHFHPWVDDQSAAGFAFSTIGAWPTPPPTSPSPPESPPPCSGSIPPSSPKQPPPSTDSQGDDSTSGRHRRKHQRRPPRLPLPRLRRTQRPHDRSTRDHACPPRRRETHLRRRLLHNRPRQALLAAARTRPDLDGSRRPKSATLAAQKAEGIITSVKDPADTIERVVEPSKVAAAEAGRPAPRSSPPAGPSKPTPTTKPGKPSTHGEDSRAPGRLEAVDPRTLDTRRRTPPPGRPQQIHPRQRRRRHRHRLHPPRHRPRRRHRHPPNGKPRPRRPHRTPRSRSPPTTTTACRDLRRELSHGSCPCHRHRNDRRAADRPPRRPQGGLRPRRSHIPQTDTTLDRPRQSLATSSAAGQHSSSTKIDVSNSSGSDTRRSTSPERPSSEPTWSSTARP